jgi:hypothetical protein
VRKEGSAIAGSRSDSAEHRLREALGARAEQVRPVAPAYRRVSAGWRRREHKRRLILAVLAAMIFAAADAIGLWALNQARVDSHVIFSETTHPRPGTIAGVGQP